MTEVYGALFSGRRFCQPALIRPRWLIASMSYASANVTTSASRPSITDRACLPDPPWDWLIVTAPPPRRAHSRAKAALISW